MSERTGATGSPMAAEVISQLAVAAARIAAGQKNPPGVHRCGPHHPGQGAKPAVPRLNSPGQLRRHSHAGRFHHAPSR